MDECADDMVVGNVSTHPLTIDCEDGGEDGGDDKSVGKRVDDVKSHHSPST